MRGLVQFAQSDLIGDSMEIVQVIHIMYKDIVPDVNCLNNKPKQYVTNAINHLQALWDIFDDNHQLLIESDIKDDDYFTTNVYERIKKQFDLTIKSLQSFKHEATEIEEPSSPRDELIQKQHEYFTKLYEIIKETNIDELNTLELMEDFQCRLNIIWVSLEYDHWHIRHKFHGLMLDTAYEFAYINYKIMYQTTLSLINYKMDYILNPVFRVIPQIGIPTWRMFDMYSEIHPFAVKSQVWEKFIGLGDMVRNNKVSEADKRQLLIRTFLTYQMPPKISLWSEERANNPKKNANKRGPVDPEMQISLEAEVD